MWREVTLVAALVAVALARDFQGHSVLRVVPETEEQLLAVHQYLETNPTVSTRTLLKILSKIYNTFVVIFFSDRCRF